MRTTTTNTGMRLEVLKDGWVRLVRHQANMRPNVPRQGRDTFRPSHLRQPSRAG